MPKRNPGHRPVKNLSQLEEKPMIFSKNFPKIRGDTRSRIETGPREGLNRKEIRTKRRAPAYIPVHLEHTPSLYPKR